MPASPLLQETLQALQILPRRVKRRRAALVKITLLRLVLAPFLLLGIGSILVAIMVTAWWLGGTDHPVTIDAITTAHPTKSQAIYYANYHVAVDGQPFTGQQMLTADQFNSHAGIRLRTLGHAPFIYSQPLAGDDSGLANAGMIYMMALFCVAGGLAAARFAYWKPLREKRLYQTGVAVQGEIVRKVQGFRGKLLSYSALYEFTTATKETQLASQPLSPPQYKVIEAAQPVIVIYDPATPEESLLYDYRGFQLNI